MSSGRGWTASSMGKVGIMCIAARLVVAAAAWWALTDGATGWDAWVIGVPAIVGAAWMSVITLPPTRFSWAAALRYASFFVRESWLGGVDVARRAFAPRVPLAPDIVRHELRVGPDLARVFVINTSSLLPGSLAVDCDDGMLLVHVLDRERPVSDVIDAAEERVSAMLRVEP